MKQIVQFFVVIFLIVGGVVAYNSVYTISETQQGIITQFGEAIGDPVTEAGLHFKIPFVQKVNMIEKRILEWDGDPSEMPTKEKTFIMVDTFARWRVSDAKQFYLRLRDERSAQSRLNDIIGSATRGAIATHELTEVVRTTVDRTPTVDLNLENSTGSLGTLQPIVKGRARIEQEVFETAAPRLRELGIELLDVRFKRLNYDESVQRRIFERMISERRQIAERFRSEGAGEAAKITGLREKDLQRIESEAYRKVLEIRGEADARATEVYASAYNKSEAAVEFYEFIKSLEAYEKILGGDTTLVLTTDSELFKYLKAIER